MGTYCTAAITVRVTCKGKIVAQYWPTHYGHSMLLGHLRLTENDRLSISGKLLQGVTFERILDDIRSSTNNTIQRIHLTTRKDIVNIQQIYGLREANYHKDDATSVMAWVDSMKRNSPSPVLLHKKQGVMPTTEFHYLEENDSILVLQTPMQAEMWTKQSCMY